MSQVISLDTLQQGGGLVTPQAEPSQSWHLWRPTTPTAQHYTNAQVDDYRRDGLIHRPPLRLTLNATFSDPSDTLGGTAGFGFWNAPFAPGSTRLRLPRAAWFFFGGPPFDVPLAQGVPGYGFKAATLDAITPLFGLLLPTAPLGFVAMRVPFLYRRLWPIAQHAIRASEHLLAHDITQTHSYRLDWLPNRLDFYLNERLIHRSRYSPRGPLGFVAWLDNQYAIATPQGRFGWGVVETETDAWLSLEKLSLTPL